MRVLVTGAAGFIGFHVAAALMRRGDAVAGFDSVNDYYDPRLKAARLAGLDRTAAATGAAWRFHRADLADGAAVAAAFAEGADGGPFDRVIHLAAQAGVRYSLSNPLAYGSRTSRLPERARRLPPRRARTPDLRLEQLRLRRQHQDAVLRGDPRRPPRLALRRDQARERADGPHLRPSLRGCRRRACASSPSTDPGAAPTCRRSCS